jgi:hypothetical protein
VGRGGDWGKVRRGGCMNGWGLGVEEFGIYNIRYCYKPGIYINHFIRCKSMNSIKSRFLNHHQFSYNTRTYEVSTNRLNQNPPKPLHRTFLKNPACKSHAASQKQNKVSVHNTHISAHIDFVKKAVQANPNPLLSSS